MSQVWGQNNTVALSCRLPKYNLCQDKVNKDSSVTDCWVFEGKHLLVSFNSLTVAQIVFYRVVFFVCTLHFSILLMFYLNIQFRIISNNYWTQTDKVPVWLVSLIQMDLLTHVWPAFEAVLQNFAIVQSCVFPHNILGIPTMISSSSEVFVLSLTDYLYCAQLSLSQLACGWCQITCCQMLPFTE